MTSTTIALALPDGRTASLALHLPAGDAPAPAVLVVQEWWGVNADLHAHAERLAEAGFLAAIPDLYFGEVTTDPARALALMMEMKTETSMAIVAAARDALAHHPRMAGKLGITGFCLGGGMAIAAACTVPGIAAAVPFYGIPREDFLTFSPSTPPISGHYGATDGMITPDKIRAVQARAHAAGAPFELHVHEGAGHAFLRRADPKVFVAAAAETAWREALAFLHAHLG